MRYYYKKKDGTGFANLKSPLTEEEFEELTTPYEVRGVII